MIPSENIIYQTRAWKILARSFELDRTAGTYLLYGSEGTGRWLLAMSFTALLNCENPQKLENNENLPAPCGQCRNCHNIFSLGFEGLRVAVPIPPHGDKLDQAIDLTNEFVQQKREEPFAIITSASTTNIPVSIARDIKKNLSLKANPKIRRTVVFYEMEKMRTSSADALLKMVEEPPADAVIMLITGNPDSLLPTIQSRSQKVKVEHNSPAVIENYLVGKYKTSVKKAHLISRLAEGSIGRAIAMAESSDEDDASQRGVALLLFKSLFLDENSETLARMNDVLNFRDRGETEQMLRLWQLLIRDCSGLSVTGSEEEIVNIDFSSDIKKLSSYFANHSLAPLLAGEIKNTLADLRLNVHIQGALMALALRLKSNIKAAN